MVCRAQPYLSLSLRYEKQKQHFAWALDIAFPNSWAPRFNRLILLARRANLSYVLYTQSSVYMCSSMKNRRRPWYLLTYSMVQNPSWEANWFAASQEIPRILWNPKVHYRTHKPPPPVSILGQPSPVHIPTSHLLEIHPNIIHPSSLGLPSGLLPSGFPTKTL